MTKFPRLRPIEIIPFRHEGKDAFALRDPSGIAERTMVVSPAVVFLLERFDGARSLDAIAAEFRTATGMQLPDGTLEQLVDGLDAAHFLLSEGFAAHRESVIEAFRAAPFRAAAHAGSAYPEDRESLLDWYFSLEVDAIESEPDTELIGAAAPHIDVRFGGASCRQVHEALARRRPDLDTLVVLGTGHGAGEDLFTLTRQRYATPLRNLETDGELVSALESRLGRDRLFAAEILHKTEHSVEFQALFTALAAGDRTPPKLLPVLVGSFHPFLESGQEPWSSPLVRGFVETLREEIARLGRRTAILASIDLSHLGPRYGDERGLTRDEAARIEIADRELLRFAEDGDAEGFFFHNQAARDERRVCGFGALYLLLRLLPEARGTLLRYEQTTFPDTEDTVAHCAMLFERDRP
jgi:AmmeMemoRadiSam system protein B